MSLIEAALELIDLADREPKLVVDRASSSCCSFRVIGRPACFYYNFRYFDLISDSF